MPCRSDYMEPNKDEQYRQHTAKLYASLIRMMELGVPRELRKDAENIYCKTDYTEKLCTTIRNLSALKMDEYIWNGRIKECRRLADWWEKHEASDLNKENRDIKREKVYEAAKKFVDMVDENMQGISSWHMCCENLYEELIKIAKS